MCQHYYRNIIERTVCNLPRASFLRSGSGEQRLPWTEGKDVGPGGGAVNGGMLKRSLNGLKKSSREGYNSAVNSDAGDTQQGRGSSLFRSPLCAVNLSGHSQDGSVLCQQARSKYSRDPGDKFVLKAAFHMSQPFPSPHPAPSAARQGRGSRSQSTGEVVWVGGRRHGEQGWHESEQTEM